MDANRFDRLSKLFAQRWGARPAVAREATPEPPEEPGRSPELFFVQTFRAGAIAPMAGTNGRYTLTLEGGHGQTVYFSDRPDRVVGATPTDQFLDQLGFPDDDPPNAALVVETAPGETVVAVVELFSPIYDAATGGVTYEVEVLDNWAAELGVGLQEEPADLAALAPTFGAAHLFIDGIWDCPNGDIVCRDEATGETRGTIPGLWFDNFCSRTMDQPRISYGHLCVPCTTPNEDRMRDAQNVWAHWKQRCNDMFKPCNGNCRPFGWCKDVPGSGSLCPFV